MAAGDTNVCLGSTRHSHPRSQPHILCHRNRAPEQKLSKAEWFSCASPHNWPQPFSATSFFYALTAIGNMAWGLREEMQAGTMEQLYMSPAPVGLILLGRTLATLVKILPSTQGIIVLRRVILDGQSLAAVWQDGNLGWLILHSVLYFVGGLLIFRLCEQIAKRRGSLGQY